MCEHGQHTDVLLEVDGKIQFKGQAENMLSAIDAKKADGTGHEGRIVIAGEGPAILKLFLDLAEGITKNIDPPRDVRLLTITYLVKLFLPEANIVGDIKDVPDDVKRKLVTEIHKKFFGDQKDIPNDK